MRPFCLSLCLLLLCRLSVGIAAPAQPSGLRSDVVYTTRGEFVQVGPMRPLTLNAHIQQFAYEPLGVEVAFVGSEVQGDQTVHFVKTMDVRSGHEMSRLTITASTEGSRAGFQLLGWSESGKYLLLERFAPDPQDPAALPTDYLRWDLSTTPPTVRSIDPLPHLPPEAQPIPSLGYAIASPNQRWIVFKQYYQLLDPAGEPGPRRAACVLYDPEKDSYQLLSLPPGANTYDWSDQNHLRFRQKDALQSFDVRTGQISTLAPSLKKKAPAASKKYPDLALDVDYHVLEDSKGSGGHVEPCVLWIRRTPAGKLPLGAAAAGLTPDQNDPQAVWSPTGTQIAFLTHGDLCVTDLRTATELLPNEKMAVGLKLTCAEERQLAMTNMKQIGLALMMFAQDSDEHFPKSDGVNDSLYPYLTTRDVFQVGSHSFTYVLPGDTSLAKIESPAETEMGTMDLPCARVVLYADGHVKSFPKDGTP